MARRWTNTLSRADATPRAAYLNRRQIMAAGGALGAAGLLAGPAGAQPLEPNTLDEIRGYNNFYEFGYGKDDPAARAGAMVTEPWSVTVDGLVDNPGTYSIADLLDGLEVESRVYRHRCVEGWSMVIPWNGVELGDVLGKLGVQEGAKFVAFETVVQPENMPGVQSGLLDFPYREGLRLDEAMHPLAILATGLYDEPLANQNGAPIRLVVPWKYGFKSAKSLVRISLVEEQPYATWQATNPREYGFYSNVNPTVDHPRWSQATERRIGGGLFASRQDTLMFNGYGEVAPLYEGMDLVENFEHGGHRSVGAGSHSRLRKVPTWPVYLLGFLSMGWLLCEASPTPRWIEPHRLAGARVQDHRAPVPLRHPGGDAGPAVPRAEPASSSGSVAGLFVFFFVLAHFLVWALLDVRALGAVWADIVKRPYVNDRHGGLPPADPARPHLQRRDGATAGRPAVAPAPLADLSGRGAGGGPLHLAVPRLGRGAGDLRRHPRRAPRHAPALGSLGARAA